MLTPGFGAYPKTISNHPTLLNNLISYWELEESSGTRYDSVASSGNDLTDNNTVTSNPGIIRTGAQFVNANSEYLSIIDNPSLSTGNIDFTLAYWVYLDNKSTTQMTVSKWLSAGNHREYLCQYHVGLDRFRCFISATGTSTASVVVANNYGSPVTTTWIFIVTWHDATANTLNIQINNGTANSTAHATGASDKDAPFIIGVDGNLGSYLDGRVDEVGFWKKVLNNDEKTFLYNNGNGRSFK